jgi:periplasmic protein TonB
MATAETLNRDRVKAALGAAALQALLGYGLIVGLGVALPGTAATSLKLFAIAPPAPPVPPPPAQRRRPDPAPQRRPQGGAPPNLRAEPTEIVAPKPVIPLPPPLPAAEIAGLGSDRSAGAAEIAGPGTGSGGRGAGSGRGYGDGDGDGDGGDGVPPRRIRGRLRDSDYPASAWEAGIGGTVSVIYRVGVDGRVSDCAVTRSSGSGALDALTCRLIEQRFRFEPSRDPRGRPVTARIVEDHEWIVRDDPADDGRR